MINKNIENKNSLQYMGFVTLNIVKNNKIIKTIKKHNRGTPLLFSMLSATLCGQNVSEKMPRYFDMCEVLGGQATTLLSNKIMLTSKVLRNFTIYKNENMPINIMHGASFTAVINPINIVGEDRTVNILRLYHNASEDSSLLAEVELGADEQFEVNQSNGYSYMLEWVMTFDNVGNQA